MTWPTRESVTRLVLLALAVATLSKNVCKDRCGKGAKVEFDLRTLGV